MKTIKYYLFFLIISIIKIIKCVDLDSSQILCLTGIGDKTQDINIYNIPNVEKTFCSVNGVICDQNNGSLLQISLTAQKNTLLGWTDFDCFPDLTVFTGENIFVEPNFLYSINPKIIQISIDQSNINIINAIIPPLDFFSIASLTPEYGLKASFISNVKKFSTDGELINLIDDGIGMSNIVDISFSSNNIPDLSKFPKLKNINFVIGNSLNSTTINNYSSWRHIPKILLSINSVGGLIEFPIPLTTNNQALDYISISNEIMGPSQLIDLSSMTASSPDSPPFNCFFLNSGNSFNINGSFPFSSLPNRKINQFHLEKGNFSVLPDISLFEKVKELRIKNSNVNGLLWPVNTVGSLKESIDLSDNSLTGTVDESFCSLSNFNVKNNQLSGSLPMCIWCYLNNTLIGNNFIGNSFENYFTHVPNACGYSEITIKFKRVGSLGFQLTGKNLGTSIDNFKVTPDSVISKLISKDNFTGSFNSLVPQDLKVVNVSLTLPSISFIVSISDTPPIIDSIVQDNYTFTFTGSFFQYDETLISVSIGDNNLPCTVLPGCTFYDFNCEVDYPISYLEAGNKKIVINVDGKSTFSFYDVQYSPIECETPNCNDNGYCDDRFGNCICSQKWTTVGNKSCIVPNHYISSWSQVSLSTGGKFILYGYITNENENLTISIDYNNTHPSSQLQILSVGPNFIETIISSTLTGGFKRILVSQNGVTWVGQVYPYEDPELICPNNCGNAESGSCNTKTGQCTCNIGFVGLYCQAFNPYLPPVKIKVDSLKAITTISSEQTGYQLSLVSIVEIDFENNIIKDREFSLIDNPWNILNGYDENISRFSQTLNNATLILTIEQIVKNEKQFSFAGNEFTVSKDGVKISISISNWVYKSNLNTIQVRLTSDLTILGDGKGSNSCNEDLNGGNTVIEQSSNSNILKDNVNYLKVIKNGKTLFGRFQDKLLSDNKTTVAVTNLISKDEISVLIGLNLPHCTECLLDPDFSVLVSPDFKSSCDDTNNWLIPVVIVIPVFVVCCVILIVIVIVKKNSVRIRIGLRNVSLKSLKRKSRK